MSEKKEIDILEKINELSNKISKIVREEKELKLGDKLHAIDRVRYWCIVDLAYEYKQEVDKI